MTGAGIIVVRRNGTTEVHDLEGPGLPIPAAMEHARQAMIRSAENHERMAEKDDWGRGYVAGAAVAFRRSAADLVSYALVWWDEEAGA